MKITNLLFCLIFFVENIYSQTISGHSHNDYAQKYPLKTAFSAKMGSIEADVFLVKNELYVAHEAKEIQAACSLDNLYLKPLAEAIKTNTVYPLILLIDIKSQADSTLDIVVQQIANYPIFRENNQIKFVISGNRPKPEKWKMYPDFIQFDGRPMEDYTPEQWQRIGMVSDSFTKYISQKEQKNIDNEAFTKMKAVVEVIHKQGKQVRFWATTDKKKVWKALAKMGVDFINTDKPVALRKFLN